MLFNKNSLFVIFFFKSLLYILFEKEKIRLVESLSLVLCQDAGPPEEPELLGHEGNVFILGQSWGTGRRCPGMAGGLGLAPRGSLQSWGMDAGVGCAQVSWGASCLPCFQLGSSFGSSWILTFRFCQECRGALL